MALTSNDVTTPGSCAGNYSVTRTWTATDDCGNTSTASQTIIVHDVTAPVIGTPASNSIVECNGSGNSAQLTAWLASNGGASASDACGGVTWSNNFTVLSDLCGATGSATVIFKATDACGNTATTSATFTIVDTQAPIITCPGPQTRTAGSSNNYTAVGSEFNPATATDNCSAVTLAYALSGVTPGTGTTLAGKTFNAGVTTVVWTATDACGNTSSCSFTVTVNSAPCNVDYGTLVSANQTLCNPADPGNISFSSLPTGGSGFFIYQWFYKDGINSISNRKQYCRMDTDLFCK